MSLPFHLSATFLSRLARSLFKELCLVRVHLGSVRASTLQPSRIAPLLMASIVAFGLATAGHTYLAGHTNVLVDAPRLVAAAQPVVNSIVQSEPVRAAETVAAEVHQGVREMTAAIAPVPETVVREVELASGKTFTDMLTDADVNPDDALAATNALNTIYSHTKLKAGQEMTLSFTRLGSEEKLTSITFQPEATKEVVVARGASGVFEGNVKNTPLERARFAVKAEINSSLYEAGDKAGVPRAVMAALLRAYAHAVDFQRDIHPGDKFEVLYDQPTTKDGKPVGQGVIIYAALEIDGKVKPLYRVTFADGAVDYFDEKGQSVKRSLLRTPVDGARVTSNFGMRRHPLLGYSKMHQGTDFGAAPGTPIFAAGSGVVEEVGFKGAYGRFVLLRHNGRVETAYAHMSRFARGMYVGARVNQGDVIGFVGSSGRSTGPHLHFEVRENRRQVNPLSVNMPTGRVLQGKLLAQFREGQNKIKHEFSTLLAKRDSKDAAPTTVATIPSPAAGDKSVPGEIIKASTSPVAFTHGKPTNACGLRGGC